MNMVIIAIILIFSVWPKVIDLAERSKPNYEFMN